MNGAEHLQEFIIDVTMCACLPEFIIENFTLFSQQTYFYFRRAADHRSQHSAIANVHVFQNYIVFVLENLYSNAHRS